MEFPEDLPTGCPLPQATDCACEVFVISRNVPVGPNDLLSQAEKGRALDATGDAACTRHGLSVFPTRKSCLHQRMLLPHLGKHVVTATLDASHGKIADTPSNRNPEHQTWWFFKDIDRAQLFTESREQ